VQNPLTAGVFGSGMHLTLATPNASLMGLSRHDQRAHCRQPQSKNEDSLEWCAGSLAAAQSSSQKASAAGQRGTDLSLVFDENAKAPHGSLQTAGWGRGKNVRPRRRTGCCKQSITPATNCSTMPSMVYFAAA
jgi:hypothetical protein